MTNYVPNGQPVSVHKSEVTNATFRQFNRRMCTTGAKADAVIRLIEEDEDIALLVLAAGTGAEGPGPLVSMLATSAGAQFPVPVAIVPGLASNLKLTQSEDLEIAQAIVRARAHHV